VRTLGLAIAIALVAGISPQASAQVLYGSLVGNVTDPNGAVIPSAPVTATEQNTGVANTTTSDAGGAFQFIDLQPGPDSKLWTGMISLSS